MTRKPLIAGNWKMHKTPEETRAFCTDLVAAGMTAARVDVAVFPPFVALAAASEALSGGPVGLGAQNVHPAEAGAFTGEVSIPMLLTIGCRYVIIGHSERRALFGESNAFAAEKVGATSGTGLAPVLCVGERLEEREADRTESVVRSQLQPVLDRLDVPGELIVAYEPVWAIGTGRTATPEQAQAVHAFIRALLAERWGDTGDAVRILYGGSVKPSNAAELLARPDIDGALVGGASLEVESFKQIVEAVN